MSGTLDLFHSWRGPPAADLAFEQQLLERAAEGRPGLAFASWPGPVVVVGYAQPASDVDLEWCRKHRIPVLRRITGGTGVVHRGDLGATLALPIAHPWARSIAELYERFLSALLPGLAAAGADLRRLAEPRHASQVRSPICFEDQLADTLATPDGRKAVGCAQARRARSVLIHAAVPLGLDPELYAAVFRVEPKRVAKALAAAVPGGEPAEVAAAVGAAIAAALELEPGPRSRPEIPERLLSPWREPRWAPVADPTLPPPAAK